MHPANIILATAFFALALLPISLGVYYLLPPAGPGTTHYIDGATGQWRRHTWAKVAAPFYATGQHVRYLAKLPPKRVG